jgi:CBS domain-containing protein
MSRTVRTLNASKSAAAALELTINYDIGSVVIVGRIHRMLRRKIRRLPVVQKDKLVGIVTERDLFKWVVKLVYEPNIPDDLKSLVAQSS